MHNLKKLLKLKRGIVIREMKIFIVPKEFMHQKASKMAFILAKLYWKIWETKNNLPAKYWQKINYKKIVLIVLHPKIYLELHSQKDPGLIILHSKT